MNAQPLHLPDAVDLDASSVRPTRIFEQCNHLLDDHTSLDRFYHENGYLFFRDVLDQQSVTEARDAMLAVAADEFGLVEKADALGRWTGKAAPQWAEELPVFAGISRRLIENPANQELLAKILGQSACMVPIVQYRLYPPNNPLGMVHQDGFYSPGIRDYRPLWIPLVACPREVGGLAIAVGEHKKGLVHNLAKPNPFPIPEGIINPDSWATIDFEPGDLLVVHPDAPHVGTANTSDRLRISFDTRVQSAANPSAFAATVTAFTPTSVTVEADDPVVGTVTLSVDAESYLRPISRGKREAFETFAEYMMLGMRLVVVREGDRCAMLREGSQN
ncbi:phytanoyl-CoA dioxygenase family protein [Novosphingobium taihuense]|uniref:Ectoine hydroxylase-related dioxygenase (Phytanoyl-CoA dioxygenase family) n=1 Tax=Novosphingobium taihuense TaxID=260085 RepID=A0A7W7ADQ9_9SPHN|nr:phytanoyl-CoA dioxygenase family protein [Novosphingobium taihuense]MBB4614247.1 ectoine hydroxylase-related dioxygenase (phytanoyl-CoA dioxygenase family) [Novosphingobium taihuense]TWH87094.1 1-deoxypentalenic acid 11beta-hydroxylase [Novosphingobium taihuense]